MTSMPKKPLGGILPPVLLFLILISSLVSADIYQTNPSEKACVGDTLAQYNWTVMNETGDWNTVSKNVTCMQNCSSTLGDCRADEPYQLYYFLGIITASFVVLMFALWIGKIVLMIDFPIYMIMVMFFAFMGGWFDVFNSQYQTALLGFTLIPLAFFFYSLWDNIRLRRKGRASGR